MKDDKKAFREIEKSGAGIIRWTCSIRLFWEMFTSTREVGSLRCLQKVLAIERPDNPMAVFSMASYYEQKGEKDLYNRQLDMLFAEQEGGRSIKVNI